MGGGMEELKALYAELDEALAGKGWVCGGCGECCHFESAGHILYASAMEKRYLLASGERPEEPDGAGGLLEEGLRCPYQKGGKCLARLGRPLGCRLHFCGVGDGGDESEFYEYWHTRLKRLHGELGEEWRYGPLLPLKSGAW